MKDTIVVFAVVEASASDAETVFAAVVELARQSQLEAGCLRYDGSDPERHRSFRLSKRSGKATTRSRRIAVRQMLKCSRQQSEKRTRRFGPASASWPAKRNLETEVLCDSGTAYGPPPAAGSEVRLLLELRAAVSDGRCGWAGDQEKPRRLK